MFGLLSLEMMRDDLFPKCAINMCRGPWSSSRLRDAHFCPFELTPLLILDLFILAAGSGEKPCHP